MIAEQTTDYKSEGAGYGFGVQPKLVRNERVPRPCSEETEFLYDGNGNMTTDLDRNIVSIRYIWNCGLIFNQFMTIFENRIQV